MNILLTCNSPGLAGLLNILKNIMTFVQIIVPILLIVFTTIKLIQFMNNPEDKKMPKKLVNSVLAAIIVFIVPVFINTTMSMLGENFNVSSCWNSTNKNNTNPSYIDPHSDGEKGKILNDDEYEKGEKRKEENSSNSNSSKSNSNSNSSSNSNTSVSTTGLSYSAFNSKLSSMSTPSNADLESAAKANGIDSNYLTIIVGTTQREGYVNDPYLNYGWSSAMINNKVSIETMQGWDPYHSGEANYYSWTNIKNGYNNASATVKKSVYLALTNRNTKIIECNGMYSTTPASYNLLYKSNKYNCSIYEKK